MKTDRDLVLVPDTQVLLHLDNLYKTENQTLKSEGDRQRRPVPTPGQKACGVTQEDLEEQERAHLLMQDPQLKNTPRYIRRRIRREVWKRDPTEVFAEKPSFWNSITCCHGRAEEVHIRRRMFGCCAARTTSGTLGKTSNPPVKGRLASRRGSGGALTSA